MTRTKHAAPVLGLEAPALDAVAGALERRLGDAWVLYAKTRNFHWNVTGPHFKAYHDLFEAQYEVLDEELDTLAERLRALGRRSPGSMKEFLEASVLRESSGQPSAAEMIAALLADHEALARALHHDVETAEKAGDKATADFLTGLIEAHEKTAWMLRATKG